MPQLEFESKQPQVADEEKKQWIADELDRIFLLKARIEHQYKLFKMKTDQSNDKAFIEAESEKFLDFVYRETHKADVMSENQHKMIERLEKPAAGNDQTQQLKSQRN